MLEINGVVFFLGSYLRRRLQRSGAYRRGQGRTHAHAGRGRAEGGRPSHLREQAGSAQRNERRGDHGQIGTPLTQK